MSQFRKNNNLKKKYSTESSTTVTGSHSLEML